MSADIAASRFKGVWVAMVTPWDGGSLLTKSLPGLINHFLKAEVAGLFILGTTGEGTLLPPELRQEFSEAVIEACAGRLPVIVHVGHDQPAVAAELARHASRLGALAAAAAPPTRYRLTEEELLHYYLDILASWGEGPFFLYDIPGTTGNPLGAELLEELHRRAPQVIGAKVSRTDWAAWEGYLELRTDFSLLVGADELAAALLFLGATGLVSSCSNIAPQLYVALYQAAVVGNRDLASLLQSQVTKLCQLTARGRVSLIKEGLKAAGHEVGIPLPPLLPVEGNDAEAFRKALGSLFSQTNALLGQGGDGKGE